MGMGNQEISLECVKLEILHIQGEEMSGSLLCKSGA